VIRSVLVSVVLLAAIVADEGMDFITSKAWWVPALLGVWIASNAVGNLLARILPSLRGSFGVWRYRISFEFEPRVTRKLRATRRAP
jgi:hypothetical protein